MAEKINKIENAKPNSLILRLDNAMWKRKKWIYTKGLVRSISSKILPFLLK